MYRREPLRCRSHISSGVVVNTLDRPRHSIISVLQPHALVRAEMSPCPRAHNVRYPSRERVALRRVPSAPRAHDPHVRHWPFRAKGVEDVEVVGLPRCFGRERREFNVVRAEVREDLRRPDVARNSRKVSVNSKLVTLDRLSAERKRVDIDLCLSSRINRTLERRLPTAGCGFAVPKRQSRRRNRPETVVDDDAHCPSRRSRAHCRYAKLRGRGLDRASRPGLVCC